MASHPQLHSFGKVMLFSGLRFILNASTVHNMDQPSFLPHPAQSNTIHLELDAQHNINVFTFKIVYMTMGD